MVVIDTSAYAFAIFQTQLIPRRRLNVLTTVFFPVDVGFPAEDAGVFFADIAGLEEGADVEAHAVVEVGGPADGLFGQGFPADEDVVGFFAFKDGFELFFQGFGGGEAFLGAVFAVGQA